MPYMYDERLDYAFLIIGKSVVRFTPYATPKLRTCPKNMGTPLHARARHKTLIGCRPVKDSEV